MENWEKCLHVTGADLVKEIIEQIPEEMGARRGFVKLLNMIAEGTPEVQREVLILERLRAHGVDNWDGWSDVMEELAEEDAEDSDD